MNAEAGVHASVARELPVRVILGALMLVVLLASLDQRIVATALPTIAGDLGALPGRAARQLETVRKVPAPA